MWEKIKTICNHERYQVIAGFCIVVFLIWMIGCNSKVQSLNDPTKKVTRAELRSELDFLIAQANIRFSQLDQQDELKKAIAENALIWAQTGTINPIGLVMGLLAIAGVGASIDNVRKRKVIKDNLTEYVKKE